MAISLGRGPLGRPTRGTEEVLDMNVGSEIIPLVTDFLRALIIVCLFSFGVDRPVVVGGCGIGPEGDGRAAGKAEG